MSQTRIMSFVEAKSNAIVGLLVSWLFTYYGLPMFGIYTDIGQATGITACYFMLSLVRSYVMRRMFNEIGSKNE